MTADANAKATSRLVLDGPCIAGTIDRLEQGIGAKPFPRSVVETSRDQVVSILEDTVDAYARLIAPGEVGRGGTAVAGESRPSKCPTGLLYGLVQSGKTLGMINYVGLALDNGFRFVVVLTSDYVKLVEQTAKRFSALDGPLVRSSNEVDDWLVDSEHLRECLPRHGVVIVCAKNQSHLGTLLDFMDRIRAPEFPALVLDDEGDQGTPDVNARARAAGGPKAPRQAGTIHRRVVRNDAEDEIGQSIRQALRHHVYVQVTATPYALLLQSADSSLRPDFIRLLEPGVGYTGGDAFFAEQNVSEEKPKPPLVFVEEEEAGEIEKGALEAPRGLAQAMCFFLLSSAALRMMSPRVSVHGQNFLIHTSPRQGEHEKVGKFVRQYVAAMAMALGGEARIRMEWAYGELAKTVPSLPSFDILLAEVAKRLYRRNVLTVNATGSNAEFGPEQNFIVGGNILGRGLTIDNLLVTYYVRRAKTGQMDTILQHARMYGYRAALMPFTRAFLPQSLAIRFSAISRAESDLRSFIKSSPSLGTIPVEVPVGLRATRPNVMDGTALAAFRPGQQIYPLLPVFGVKELGKKTSLITKRLEALFGGELKEGVEVEVGLEEIISVIRDVPVSDEPGEWNPEAISAVLTSLSRSMSGRGLLRFRTMERKKSRYLLSGAISGDEHGEAREKAKPVLFMFRDSGRAAIWEGVPFWYPTVVFPRTMAAQVFNITASGRVVTA